MASANFERVLIKDDRIGCVTDKTKYGVLNGGHNVTTTLSLNRHRHVCSMLWFHL